MDWSYREFAGIDFGDKRLNERLKRVGQMLFEKPEAPINQACGEWDETKAAYRLFDNEKVTAEKMLDVHRLRTLERMKQHETVLAIQDTTFFNYHEHKSKEGMGNIDCNRRPIMGVAAHNTLLTTSSGLPLGLFDQKIYARKNKETRSKSYAKIETKESYRWIEAVQTLSEHIPAEQTCIVIGDREADIFELMYTCVSVGFEFIFRSTHDRVIGEKKKRWGEEQNANEYLLEFIEKQDIKAHVELEIEDKALQKKRVAKLALRFCKVNFPAPWRLDQAIDGPSAKHKNRLKGSRLELDSYIVEVKEENPPKDGQKIHWRLLTSQPISNIQEATRIVELYKIRWTIEIYHRVLKSGCNVEDCRLETFDRLKRCLTLYSVIAWRLLWMTKINHQTPNAPCSKVFSREEWQTLYKISNKTKKLPKKTPTTREAIRWLAMQGGFLARASDGEPGITTIWRGWQTLNTFLNLATYG